MIEGFGGYFSGEGRLHRQKQDKYAGNRKTIPVSYFMMATVFGKRSENGLFVIPKLKEREDLL